jgi:hypothetical protein
VRKVVAWKRKMTLIMAILIVTGVSRSVAAGYEGFA